MDGIRLSRAPLRRHIAPPPTLPPVRPADTQHHHCRTPVAKARPLTRPAQQRPQAATSHSSVGSQLRCHGGAPSPSASSFAHRRLSAGQAQPPQVLAACRPAGAISGTCSGSSKVTAAEPAAVTATHTERGVESHLADSQSRELGARCTQVAPTMHHRFRQRVADCYIGYSTVRTGLSPSLTWSGPLPKRTLVRRISLDAGCAMKGFLRPDYSWLSPVNTK